MVTKAYSRFRQRCADYDSDLELSDLLIGGFRQIDDTNQTLAVALGSNGAAHPYLGRRRNTQNSRDVIGGHLRRTLCAAFIKDLYEDFEEFVAETMVRAAQKGVDPARFIGNARPDLDAKAILGAGSWDAVVRMISDDIFRKLENERSTIKVVRGLTGRLGLNIPDATVNNAMAYLDARHRLVHQDGRADPDYRQLYPHIQIVGRKIGLSRQFTIDAKAAIDALAKAIDDQIIGEGLVRVEDMHP